MMTKHEPVANSVMMFADEPQKLQRVTDEWPQTDSPDNHVGVRPWRVTDRAAVQSLAFRTDLHYPHSRNDVPQVFDLLVRSMTIGGTDTRPFFVGVETTSGARLGALACQQVGADDRFHLQYLLSREEPENNPALISSLLEHAIGEAGSRGARRLMARIDAASPLTGALRSAGFTAYCGEVVYILPSVILAKPTEGVWAQSKSDVWAIHQLYLQTTPRDVQSAEAFTSHQWDIDPEGKSQRGWYVAVEGTPVAFARVLTSRKQHHIDLMFAPDGLTVVSDLLGTVLHELGAEAKRPIFIAVRGYQQELSAILESLGFVPDVTQIMTVRYTTAPAPARFAESFELLRAAEVKPQQVPSFCVRNAHE